MPVSISKTPPETLDEFRAGLQALDPATTKAMLERRHPAYAENLNEWEFLEETYEGGREWFQGNIFKYVKEGILEYQERVQRAYRFNHTREVIDLVNKYIFKGVINRNEDASEQVKAFWVNAMLNRRTITDFMKLVSRGSSTYGRIWICTDTNQTTPNATLIAQKSSGARVYAYTMKPADVLDFAYDTNGDILWTKVSETIRDDQALTASGSISQQYRIWTQWFWALYTEMYDPSTKEITYNLEDVGEHDLGRVPMYPVDHMPSDDPYEATGLIDDIAYLDRAVANYLSNLDTIINDQTFSQLVLPAQALLPGDDAQTKLIEMGTKRIFTYDASSTQAPQYISPDASNANVIMSVVNKIISEIYHSIGMAGERTKQDNAMGIDNSSGVAKAYDFDRMNAMLASKARSLELAENTLCELVDAWFGKLVEPGTYTLVTYPDNFDVRGLSDEIGLAQQLLLIQAPDKMRQAQMDMLVDKLFPNLSSAVLTAIKAEIQTSWPPQEVPVVAPPPSAVVKENRQGQNVSEKSTIAT